MADSAEQIQPDLQYVVAALVEENRVLNDNKLYLLSVMKQIQAEFHDAREMWDLERASLKTKTE